MPKAGILYLVPTPIGNLGDFSPRAIETLKQVDVILSEDTRHSQGLLKHFNIEKPLWSLHEHNEEQKIESILGECQEGRSFAIISDAGTPVISDPGFLLVRAAHKAGIRVSPLPGPCAAIAALCASGLPAHRFTFEGFLPSTAKARQTLLEKLKHRPETSIFYEAPHRILETLEALQNTLGPHHPTALVKEISKPFESVITGAISTVLEWILQDTGRSRGEFVLVVQGSPETTGCGIMLPVNDLITRLLKDLPLKSAVDLAVELTGEKKNRLYNLALSLQKGAPHER